jgi:hypothetical protein
MHASAWRMVEFVGRQVVAEQVAAVVGEPELPGLRLPVEADAVAYASGIDISAAAIGIHAQDIGVALRIGVADVAGRAYRHVEFAVRAEGDEFPAMMRLAGQPVGHQHGCRRLRQASLDIVVAQDAAHRRDVETAVPVGHADRALQTAGDDGDGLCFEVGAEAHRMHLSRLHRTDEKRAALAIVVPERHLPGVVDARPELDGETRRQA